MDNEATTRSLYDRLNSGDIDGFAALLSENFVEHEVTPGIPPTKAGVQQFFQMQMAAFPDMQMAIEDLIADGAKVVTRVKYTGTNTGDFMGMPATGKGVDVQFIDIFAFGSDGLLHEHWGVMDSMTLMQQLGVVPAGPLG
jgi:steroid delta-isomerase-like uncharacterized protein